MSGTDAPADGVPITGGLRKMVAQPGPPVRYELPVGDTRLALNPLIGATLAIEFTGTIRCVHCGRRTRRSYNQGYCYPCLQQLAQCDTCIVRPHLCHYHAGTCREPDWGERNCMVPHVVYLANSSGLKVGITRATQVPTRWLDQGATQALALFEVPTRRTAGLVEVTLAEHVADRTDWRAMLRGDPPALSLADAARELLAHAGPAVHAAADRPVRTLPWDGQQRQFEFPVDRHPAKVRSLTLDKVGQVSGRLHGVKGQYLILDAGVLNVRRHAGYEVSVTVTPAAPDAARTVSPR